MSLISIFDFVVRIIFCSIIFFFSVTSLRAQNKNEALLDSIFIYREYARNNKIEYLDQLKFAKRARVLSQQLDIDSTLLMSNRVLSFVYLNNDQLEPFKQINFENLGLAKKNHDSVALAVAYNNLGFYYDYNFKNDSAYGYYLDAVKIYDKLKEKSNQVNALLNMANIQKNEKDYIGSEKNAIRATKILINLPQNDENLDKLWVLNTLLGEISLKLGQLEQSLEYHEKAKINSKKMSNGFYNEVFTLNNKAFVLHKQKKYDEALELYYGLVEIKDRYDEYDPTFYPLVIDNIAYTKFVAEHSDYNTIANLFQEAYRISDSLQDDVTKLAVSIDFSKFYLHQKEYDSSLKYATTAYKISKDISSNEILLEVLKVLSKLKEGENGKAYLNEHIKLSDSLLNIERNVRNKFARIEFETDKIEEENARISIQRMWLIIVSTVLLITLFLLYIIISQRTKNKELQFEKDQQKANEEIYNLMLSQQDKVDEARANEKKRISQEMHDGILGRLFGTRLSLDSLNFSEGKEAIQNRATYIKELMTIENDIRKISHDLNTDFVSGSGFMDIVSEMIEKQTNAYQLKHQFDFTDDVSWEIVSNKNKINIYRIIQESLQNIYKHAKADAVKISFQLKNNVILLSISDDGQGFDVNKSKKGIGIKNINARVIELEGTVDFISEINKGTTITIEIPYKTNS
ncbi:ATP-binding protein [Psychroserpens ponticola]|uniref:histidine kinase n=1 Tax=Psychroserpens ponticola TaxID=2932268 RepID=A0ABY7RWP1_9FLAO|nr:tetratricopeptide repeat-containing sensor histidine kinase [Psychroserpens ponticola]WCO01354.1 ATP-binding protein [Psychroserpens ponticola]